MTAEIFFGEKPYEQQKGSMLERLAKFMGNKGFYIVLFLCVAVIGVSAWVLTYTVRRTGLDLDEDLSIRVTATLPTHTPIEIPTVNPNEINPPSTAAPQPEINPPSENTLVQEKTDSQVSAVESTPNEDVMSVTEDEPDLAPTTFVWPVTGSIMTPHSVEALVYDRTMMDWRAHKGIDISGELGAKVIAVASGTVEDIYKDQMMGTTVVIYHGGGLRSIYSNLAELPTVAVDDYVSMGDVIGAIGQTSLAEAGDVTHLHFEMTLDGQNVNPSDYLPPR